MTQRGGFGARFGAAVARAVGALEAAGSDEGVVVITETVGVATGATTGGGAAFGGAVVATAVGGGALGTRPSHPGFRQMMTAIPHAVTSTSIAMKATSFCAALGPRGWTTTVIARGRRGRSGIRIVGCIAPRGTANGGGVNGCDGTWGIGVTGASDAGPGRDGGPTGSGAVYGTPPASGVVMWGGAEGTVSSTATMTAGMFGSSSSATCAGGTLCGRDEA